MLVGLIADVHSNVVALEAVLSELDEAGVEIILHAGDMIGYNPYPNETIALFKKRNILSILGNHDRALITEDASWFNPYAAAALEWTGKTIFPENLEYIRKSGSVLSEVIDGKKLVIAHGSLRDTDEYIYPLDAAPHLLVEAKCDVLVLGHTHIQFSKTFPEGMIVNPGSVGQPRDGQAGAGFAIYDTVIEKIILKRKNYDVEKVIGDMRKAHLPEKLALRLREGY